MRNIIKYIILAASLFLPLSAAATTLGTQQGGTGIGGPTPYSVGDILYASGATTLSKLTVGNSGDCLKVNGGVPVWLNSCSGGGASFAYPFNVLTNYGTSTSATTTPIWAQMGLYASSTSHFVGFDATSGTTTNATSTNLSVSGTFNISALLNGCLQTVAGNVTSTGSSCGSSSGGSWATSSSDYYSSLFRDWSVQGNGYLAPTTTRGIIVAASSTVGDGTRFGGLTVNGNSTTTATSTTLGQAGIGTSTPRTRLEIGANTTIPEVVTVASALDSVINLIGDSDNDVAEAGVAGLKMSTDGGLTSGSIGLVQANNVDIIGNVMTGGISNAFALGPTGNASVLQLMTNANVRATIDTSGRFGIGTTTPLFPFQFSNTAPILDIGDTNAPIDAKHYIISNTDGVFTIGTTTDTVTSSSTFFIIKPSGGTFGNIFGFGTSSPSANYKMSVQGGIYAQTSNGTAFFTGHQGGSSYSNSLGIFQALSDNPTGSSNFAFKALASNVLTYSVRMDGAGNFGSTSPWAYMSVNPNNNGTGAEFAVGSSTKTDLMVANSGFVGVGTASPTHVLEVSGAVNGAVVQINNNAQNGGIQISRTGSGTGNTLWQVTTNGGSQFTADSNLSFGSTAVGNVFNINSSGAVASTLNVIRGNVGIGTTSPFAMLDILSTLNNQTPLLNIASSTNGLATSSAFFIAANGDLTATGGINLTSVPTGCVISTAGLISSNGVACSTWATSSTDYYQSLFGTWKVDATGALTPTTTRPILVNNASSTITNLTTVNASSTNATTSISAVGNLTASGSTTLQNFTAKNATTTNATSTQFALTSTAGNAAGTFIAADVNGVLIATSTPSPTNASQTVKGIVQEATPAQINAGTQVGSTGAELFVNPSSLAVSIFASTTASTTQIFSGQLATTTNLYAGQTAIVMASFEAPDGNTNWGLYAKPANMATTTLHGGLLCESLAGGNPDILCGLTTIGSITATTTQSYKFYIGSSPSSIASGAGSAWNNFTILKFGTTTAN